jgi:hydrogenase maturation protein HypF
MTPILQRLRILIRGAVQGVGFRPHVYRLAADLGLPGWVSNSAQGVSIEVEGGSEQLERFLLQVERDRPPRAAIQSLEYSILPPVGYPAFEIRPSETGGERTALVLPDIATCADCLRELFTPSDRRYLYPFTNCTNCGPRFSIIRALPYDRPHTTMAGFPLCDACRAEYDDPTDRRFHAQPNACPACGPHVELWDPHGTMRARHEAAIRDAAEALKEGQILALKGLGGFQLLVDARDEDAVRRLRQKKGREEKPFAVMAPSLGWVQSACRVAPLEERLLRSPESPILLLARRDTRAVAPAVAPGNPSLGVMLPYTPLHHLLLHALGFPVVATSGNLSDEPICTDEHEALDRLQELADAFLVHDRPIARHVDDSVARILGGRESILRRARGYAPLPIPLPTAAPACLAVGAHLKNTVAVSIGKDAFLSQHIGDLETIQAFQAFHGVVEDLQRLYAFVPTRIAADLHPDYLSTRDAHRRGLPVISVQHHYAHVLSCMAEHGLAAPVLGVAWDGTGFGPDGTVWGGEFLRIAETGFDRVAHLRTFRLPGGEQAVREPRRSAIGLLFEADGEAAFTLQDLNCMNSFSPTEQHVIRQSLIRNINSPTTSSIGRLFDAVSAILGLRLTTTFEGQGAMELEWAIGEHATDEAYPFALTTGDSRTILDWSPMLRALLSDRSQAVPAPLMAARFHNGLAEGIVAVARHVGVPTVALSGGCFQNRYLTERAVRRLREAGFSPWWHQRVPPNDGGIALGQILAAGRAVGC